VKRASLFILQAALAVLWSTVALAKTVHYYYTDPQGTVLAKTDASGHVLVRSDYRPYGSPAQAQGTLPAGPGYTGHVNDPDTGLVYMQARYYDPGVGRFLTVDPVDPTAANEFNFNRFVYANGNPIINTDPSGMDDCGPHCMEHRAQSDAMNSFSGLGSGPGGEGAPKVIKMALLLIK